MQNGDDAVVDQRIDSAGGPNLEDGPGVEEPMESEVAGGDDEANGLTEADMIHP